MIDTTECDDYLVEVRQTAAGIGQADRLAATLDQLARTGEEQGLESVVRLFRDEQAPLSFLYHVQFRQGGRTDFAYAGAVRWDGAAGWTIYP